MGAYSTLYVSRDKAQAALLRHVFNMSDSDLEEALDRKLRDSLYRVTISETGSDNEEFDRANG